MVKVSIILCTYNSASFIRRTVESVLAQKGAGSEFEIELLAIDDASADETTDIIKSYGIIPYLNSVPSGGPNRGRNIGLRNATGDFIAFIDHDDTWHPDKIASQLTVAGMAPIITTGYHLTDISRKKEILIGTGEQPLLFYDINVTFRNRLARRNSGQPAYMSTIMISRKLSTILFEEEFGCVDYDWLVRIFENNASVHCNRPLATRFVYGLNLSLQRSYREKEYALSLRTAGAYLENYPAEAGEALYRINGTRARYHYVMGEMSLAREYFKKSAPGIKTTLYYLTTFAGSAIIKRFFRVFG
ncbi:MAG: glycosyltransferase family 2 protein [Bacteroidales bacterium]|nr:glycosyltransferase family 2 protein [Bacteroidales bacterium]